MYEIWIKLPLDTQTLKIRKWLSAPDPSVNFQKALRLREPSTGLWLLENDVYKQWKDEASFMWLHGIPGCGKTILISTLLESLIKHATVNLSEAVAYFYFDFNEQQKLDPDLMIRSLISQLLQQCMKIPSGLYELYSTCYYLTREIRKPLLSELLKMLKQLIECFPCTYVIIDALDECKGRTELMLIIQEMHAWQMQGLHVLFTSRREGEIEDTLGHILDNNSIMCVQTEAVDHDIQLYIRQRLANETSLWKWQADTDIKNQVESLLVKGAHGTFRWAVCQLDILAQCRNRVELLEALADLPPDLDKTYDRILCAIKKSDLPYAIRILRWLVFSYRPLTLTEVAEVAAIDADRCPSFDRNEVLQDPLDFLSIFSSLVIVANSDDIYLSKGNDGEHNGENDYEFDVHPGTVVLLAHYSVKEYLVSERVVESTAQIYSLEPEICHRFIAKCCVQYLLQFDKPGALTSTNLHCFALAKYSAQAWTQHTKLITERDVEMIDSIMELLDVERESFLTSIRLFDPDRFYKGTCFTLILSIIPSPLYYACRAGLGDVTRRLLSETNTDVNASEGRLGNALQAASYYGHFDVVQLLVEKGSNVNIGGQQPNVEFKSPLLAAIYHGHLDIVQFLVDMGANMSALGRNALQTASFYGYLDIVRLLVEKGADITPADRPWQSSLHDASICGHIDVVRFLVERGANVNQKEGHAFNATSRATALQEGSLRGHVDIVKILVENGADVNVQGGSSGNALQAASSRGHLDIVKILVEKGADVNAKGGKFGNALKAASSRGYLDIVQFLVENGAGVNEGVEVYEDALAAALSYNHLGIVQLLVERGANVSNQVRLAGVRTSTYVLNAASSIGDAALIGLLIEKGADVNAQSGSFGHALQAAAFKGDLDVVTLLVKEGADVNAQGGEFGHALQAASAKGHLDIVRFFVEGGADVNAQGGKFGHALQAASAKGDVDIVKFLVKNGASVDAQGGQFGHALQAASSEGYLDIVKFLVKNGADVNLQGGKFGHSLQAAAAKGDLDTVEFLVEECADVDAWGGEYCNALQAATNNGHLEVVQLLVQRGANVNAPGGKFGHALQAASSKGYLGIVKFLVERGADINARGEDNCDALQAASNNSYLHVMQFLVEKGANINAQCTSDSGPNALYTASRRGDLGVVKFLVEKGANVDAKGGKLGNALQAASSECLDIVKFLVENGADVNAHGGKFGHALQRASAKQNLEVVRFLVEHGADVNAQGGKFGHALQAASSKGDLGIVKFLVENGADINAQGGKFGNAMQAALDYNDNNYNDDENVAEFLLEKDVST